MALDGSDVRGAFRFEYDPPVIRYGIGSVADLGDELAEHGFDRALVVCGRTVGDTPEVIDPVTEGLGDRLAGVFAETTPEKRLATALDGRDALDEHDADALVSLGGGSSLDAAKAIAVVAADDRDPTELGTEFRETGTITPEGAPTPIVAVPTTLAGADLSQGAGLTADPVAGPVDEPVAGSLSDRRLMPRAVVYDPALFATTPKSILAGSAMNGFDKGIETLYARSATPVTDGTAVRGLQLLVDALRELGEGEPDPEVLAPVVQGIILVQYGFSRTDETTMSIIHAFGHGLTTFGRVQQGVAHGVVAPHVLRYCFEHVDARRDLLARGLGVADAAGRDASGEPSGADAPEDADDTAGAIVGAVEDVRDALGLPTRLRDVEGPDREAFGDVAEFVLADSVMANAPAGVEPTGEDIEAILEAAY